MEDFFLNDNIEEASTNTHALKATSIMVKKQGNFSGSLCLTIIQYLLSQGMLDACCIKYGHVDMHSPCPSKFT